jgi:hypothetical protein
MVTICCTEGTCCHSATTHSISQLRALHVITQMYQHRETIIIIIIIISPSSSLSKTSSTRVILQKAIVFQPGKILPKFYCPDHTSLPLVPILSQMNLTHKVVFSSFKTQFYFIPHLFLGLPRCLVASSFLTPVLYAFLIHSIHAISLS